VRIAFTRPPLTCLLADKTGSALRSLFADLPTCWLADLLTRHAEAGGPISRLVPQQNCRSGKSHAGQLPHLGPHIFHPRVGQFLAHAHRLWRMCLYGSRHFGKVSRVEIPAHHQPLSDQIRLG